MDVPKSGTRKRDSERDQREYSIREEGHVPMLQLLMQSVYRRHMCYRTANDFNNAGRYLSPTAKL